MSSTCSITETRVTATPVLGRPCPTTPLRMLAQVRVRLSKTTLRSRTASAGSSSAFALSFNQSDRLRKQFPELAGRVDLQLSPFFIGSQNTKHGKLRDVLFSSPLVIRS